MGQAKNILPVDPRPSRADPGDRAARKQLEKQHGYGWLPPIILGLLGITLAFDVPKDVEKCKARRKDGGEEGKHKREGRKRGLRGSRERDGERDESRAGLGERERAGEECDGGRRRRRGSRRRSECDATGHGRDYDEDGLGDGGSGGVGHAARRGHARRQQSDDGDYAAGWTGPMQRNERRTRPRPRRNSSDW